MATTTDVTTRTLLERTLGELSSGYLPSEIYSDPELYRIEQEQVFGRAWVLVGLTDMVREPGDYITTRMGEDSVILARDVKGVLRVLLNKCTHRGNKVCLFDRGNTKTFACSYHGWSFDTAGNLIGVPGLASAYLGALDKQENHLKEARVATYGDMVFACWSHDTGSLDDYLGDMRWYLDAFLLSDDFGGLDVLPGKHRATIPINWKVVAEQFVGDHYHFKETHISAVKVADGIPNATLQQMAGETVDTSFEVSIGGQGEPPHSVGQILVGDQYHEVDLQEAEKLGPDAVDWVRKRKEVLDEKFHDLPVTPYGLNRGHIFPNLSLIHMTGGLVGVGIHLWHPVEPGSTEMWEWCAVARNAPDVVKQAQRQSIVSGHGIAGLIHSDDMENFSRISDNLQTSIARQQTFNYTMALGFEGGDHPALADVRIEPGIPGQLTYHTTEVNQRRFITYWAEQLLEVQRGQE